MSKKVETIKVTRNGKEVIYNTLPKAALFEANKRIEKKMIEVVKNYKASAVASKASTSKLILNF